MNISDGLINHKEELDTVFEHLLETANQKFSVLPISCGLINHLLETSSQKKGCDVIF